MRYYYQTLRIASLYEDLGWYRILATCGQGQGHRY
jgi:hypothetical protein